MAQLILKAIHTHNIGPISLCIESRRCVAVVGTSGSGKTLLLRAVVDLDPHQGTAILDNKDCSQYSAVEWRRHVGMMASKTLWWFDTVAPHFKVINNKWLQQLALDKDIMAWPVSRLSNGEQQRLALLRLLANRPKVLLLDEPTANLDQENIQRMENLIAQYKIDNDCAVIWITHDINQAYRVADNYYRLENGLLSPIAQK